MARIRDCRSSHVFWPVSMAQQRTGQGMKLDSRFDSCEQEGMCAISDFSKQGLGFEGGG